MLNFFGRGEYGKENEVKSFGELVSDGEDGGVAV